MSYLLVIIEQAANDLEQESDYSEHHWGRNHARQYVRELYKRIKGLTQNPSLFRTHDEVLPGLRMLTFKVNNILYWINESKNRWSSYVSPIFTAS